MAHRAEKQPPAGRGCPEAVPEAVPNVEAEVEAVPEAVPEAEAEAEAVPEAVPEAAPEAELVSMPEWCVQCVRVQALEVRRRGMVALP